MTQAQGENPQEKGHRRARSGETSRTTKAKNLAALGPKVGEWLKGTPPATARTSAAYQSILPQAETILGALRRGYSANAIATILEDRANGPVFSVETLRTAIKRLQDEAKNGAISTGRAATTVPQVSTKSSPQDAARITRLDEDL